MHHEINVGSALAFIPAVVCIFLVKLNTSDRGEAKLSIQLYQPFTITVKLYASGCKGLG